MTAKEYLSQIRTLDIIIEQKRHELDDLHDIATSIGSFDYSSDRVQTSPKGEAPYARVAEKAAEIDEEIRRLEDERRMMTTRMDEVCRDILTSSEYMVICLRYYDGRDWSDVKSLAGFKERTMYNFHARAINKLELQDIVW